jgi:hypothetical protein
VDRDVLHIPARPTTFGGRVWLLVSDTFRPTGGKVDGREIRVEVARVEGGSVRLAVTAPDDVAIWREEIALS